MLIVKTRIKWTSLLPLLKRRISGNCIIIPFPNGVVGSLKRVVRLRSVSTRKTCFLTPIKKIKRAVRRSLFRIKPLLMALGLTIIKTGTP